MPKPAGWTDEMLAKRDRCVEKRKAAGMDESRAYAICTAAIKDSQRRKGKS